MKYCSCPNYIACGHSRLGGSHILCGLEGYCEYQLPKQSQWLCPSTWQVPEALCEYCHKPISKCQGHTTCVVKESVKPEYYYKGSITTYTEGVDPEATCWHCGKTFLCDAMDACCRLCGAPFDKNRCKEFNFTINKGETNADRH